MKPILITLFISFQFIGFGQQLTIDSCYALAERNFPLYSAYDLIQQSSDYSVSNLAKGYLPRLSLNGQATYQSDVTQLPFSLPGVNNPTISKDQYKVYGEVVQPITGLFVVKDQQTLAKANTEIELQKNTVELYKIKERINELFFGILLLNQQEKQLELTKKDLETALTRVENGIKSGVSTQNDTDLIKAELLNIEQRSIELNAGKNAYLQMLSVYLQTSITAKTELISPKTPSLGSENNRPELQLYALQEQSLNAQLKLRNASYLPQFNLFVQSGYGRPALNMLNNDFKLYAIGGLKFNWNISDFYTLKKDKQLIEINRSRLDIQRQAFIRSIDITQAHQQNELMKYSQLIEKDQEIIDLRTRISAASQSKLENGIITANDYIIAVNAEQKAKDQQAAHQIQSLMTGYAIQLSNGN